MEVTEVLEELHYKLPILIVGATGNFGSILTEYALKEHHLLVNILVRDPTRNRELCAKVEKAGGRVLKGDLSDPESLKDCTKGIHTVVSAIRDTNEKVTVEGQKALLEDGVRNGIKRLVPTEYGLDITRFSREELLASQKHAFKAMFEDYFRTTNVPLLRFHIGIFTHTLFEIIRDMGCYYGEPDLKHNVTSMENAAKLVIAAVITAELTGDINYSGGDYTMEEVQDIYNTVRDSNLEIRRIGGLKDLKYQCETVKKQEGNSDKAKFLASLLIFYDERSKFPKLDNDSFPDVKPESLEEFLQAHPDINV